MLAMRGLAPLGGCCPRKGIKGVQRLKGAQRRRVSSAGSGNPLAEMFGSALGGGSSKKRRGGSALGDREWVKQGKVSGPREVPKEIPRPDYWKSGQPPAWKEEIQSCADGEERAAHRAAGRLAREVLDMACAMARPGVTTDEIDAAVHAMVVQRGAYPSPLNYHRFPKSVCTSVNEVICHGIPDSRALVDGDILNVDVTVFYRGYHGDTSRMVEVGAVDEAGKQLIRVTKECLDLAIAECAPGVRVDRIGEVIQAHAEKHGYGVVKNYVGHGVGRIFHSAPTVIHAKNRSPWKMQPGMTFTIEPMLTENGRIAEKTWADGWTVTTADGARSAQFEHTLRITESGVELLTGPDLPGEEFLDA